MPGNVLKSVALIFVVMNTIGASCSKQSSQTPSTQEVQFDQYFKQPETVAIDNIERGPVAQEQTDAALTTEFKFIELAIDKDQVVAGTTASLRVFGVSDNTKLELTKQSTYETDKTEIAAMHDTIPAVVVGKAAGEVEVTAKFRNFTVTKKLSVTEVTIEKIEITPKTITVGSKQQFYATGFKSDGTTQDLTNDVEWASANALIIEPQPDAKKGVFLGVRAGNTNLGATFNSRIANSAVEAKLMQLSSLAVELDLPSVLFGTKVQLRAIGTYSNGSKGEVTGSVKWRSLTDSLATVSDELATKGLVSTLSAGDALIEASFGGVTGTVSLNITSVSFYGYHFEPAPVRIPKGKKQNVKFFGDFLNGTKQDITQDVIWESTKPFIANPSNVPGEEGLIETYESGDTTISVTYGQTTREVAVEVTEATIVTVNILNTSPNVTCGLEKPKLKAEGVFSDGTVLDISNQVTWLSNNATVAAVSNDLATRGTLETLQPGSASISATIIETVLGQTVVGSMTIAVNEPVLQGYKLATAYDSVPVGTNLQIYAFADYSCVKTPPIDATSQLDWSISDETFAVVSNSAPKGMLQSSGAVLSLVKVNITASKNSLAGTKEITIRPKEIVDMGLVLLPSSAVIEVGQTLQVYARAIYSDNSTLDITDGSQLPGSSINWSALTPADLSVNNSASKGQITGINEGPLKKISATLVTPENKSFTGNILLAVRSPCASGKRSDNYCWFESDLGQSCAEKCAAISGMYVNGDVISTGSAGTTVSCSNVLQRFGYLTLDKDNQPGLTGTGTGCSVLDAGGLLATRRYTTPTTLGTDKHPNLRRLCSCRD